MRLADLDVGLEQGEAVGQEILACRFGQRRDRRPRQHEPVAQHGRDGVVGGGQAAACFQLVGDARGLRKMVFGRLARLCQPVMADHQVALPDGIVRVLRGEALLDFKRRTIGDERAVAVALRG